jgi:hypothetical protein
VRQPVQGMAVQVDPIKHPLKAPGTRRSKLKCDELLSSVAFDFNLRRYTKPCDLACEGGFSAWGECDAECGGGVQRRAFAVIVKARGAGAQCAHDADFVVWPVELCTLSC